MNPKSVQDCNQHFDWSRNQASDCSYQRVLEDEINIFNLAEATVE